MPDENSVYNLKLHETIEIQGGTLVTAVPGGWIYTTRLHNRQNNIAISTCFVPKQNAFPLEVKIQK